MCTGNDAIKIFHEVYELCAECYGDALHGGYLYGSYARGDYTDESDVDILLTVDADISVIAANRRKIAKISSAMSLKYDVTVSVTVKPVQQFTAYADVLPFYRNVISEGICYGA